MAYEPQVKFLRKLAIALNKQNTFGTAVAASAYVNMLRNPGDAFVQINPDFYSDEQLAGKGHEFPTVIKRILEKSAFDWKLDGVDNVVLGWLLAFCMGADTVTGTGPFTHVFKFLQSTNQWPVTTLLCQDTADVIFQALDMAIMDLQITGIASGPLQAQMKMIGSGKVVDGAVTFPALASPLYLYGSDADILFGPPAPDSSLWTLSTQAGGAQAQHTAFYKFTAVNAAGESVASSEISIVVPANSVSKATAPAALPALATSWNVYASTSTGTETRQATGIVGGGNFVEPNTGFTAGAALPTDTTALTSIKERVNQWDVHLTLDMVENRAPGGGLWGTFMKTTRRRANLTVQVDAKDVDDIRTLWRNDTPMNWRVKVNSGASQIVTFDYPYLVMTAPAAALTGNEVQYPLQSTDKHVLKWQGQEVFTATLVNNTATYLTGA
jgi:hypothetical protein